jgi:putative DNA primase/helicase
MTSLAEMGGQRPNMDGNVAVEEHLVPCGPALLTADASVINGFLDGMVVSGVHLAWVKPDGPLLAGWFGDDVSAATKWAIAKNLSGHNVYWTPNLCRAGLDTKPKKTDIEAARFVYVDIDPPKTGGRLDRTSVLNQIDQLDLPPTVVIDSGNGVQALWKIDAPCPDALQTELINLALAQQLGGDSCANVDRLLRLPGTINYPTASKAKRGYVPVASSIISMDPALLYTVEDFRRAFPAATPPRAGRPPNPVQVELGNVPPLAATDLKRDNHREVRKMIKRPEDHFRTADRSAWAYGIASAMVKDGYSDAEVIGILMNPALPGCAHIHDQADPMRASRRTLSSAKKGPFKPGTLGFAQGENRQPASPLEEFGDVFNARFIANSRSGKLAFVHQVNRWMEWTDGRWRYCNMGEEFQHAKNVCAEIYAAAAEGLRQNPDGGRRAAQQALKAYDMPRIKAMLELAKSDPEIAVLPDKLDADPLRLGVANGVVDLKTGALIPNDPELWITRSCAAEYTPGSTCPLWLQFLHEVFEGDSDTIGAFQRLLGYSLSGYAREEVIVFCVGRGANGKSVANNVVHEILADYAKVGPASLLVLRRSDDNSPRADFASLVGARYVTINETQERARLDEQAVKILAGRERISARPLYKEHIEFNPSFTPWLRTNHKPIITGDDEGIWRRLVILSFRRTFSPEEQDPDLVGKLLAERDGILTWMVEGAQQYLTGGLRPSDQMRRDLAAYRTESDLLGEYLADRTTSNPNGRVERRALYSDWRFWCDRNGYTSGSAKSFTQRLAERGHVQSKVSGAPRSPSLGDGAG